MRDWRYGLPQDSVERHNSEGGLGSKVGWNSFQKTWLNLVLFSLPGKVPQGWWQDKVWAWHSMAKPPVESTLHPTCVMWRRCGVGWRWSIAFMPALVEKQHLLALVYSMLYIACQSLECDSLLVPHVCWEARWHVLPLKGVLQCRLTTLRFGTTENSGVAHLAAFLLW